VLPDAEICTRWCVKAAEEFSKLRTEVEELRSMRSDVSELKDAVIGTVDGLGMVARLAALYEDRATERERAKSWRAWRMGILAALVASIATLAVTTGGTYVHTTSGAGTVSSGK
jgi:hypothetical protein